MKSEPTPIVMMTTDQLRALVREEVSAALASTASRDESDVMSTEQTAKLVGVHENTIPRLVARDGLPTLRRVGKLRRFSRRAVVAWLEVRKTGT